MTRPTLTLIQGGRRAPPIIYPRDDLAASQGIMIITALSVPLWWPTYCGLVWLAAVARVVVGVR